MGTDGGTDTTIERPPGLEPDLDGDLELGVDGLDIRVLDVELERVVEGLRVGDLAFVVTAAARLGPAIGICLAAAGAAVTGEQVADVAFALADLTADPATSGWSPGALLAASVADVVEAPRTTSGPGR